MLTCRPVPTLCACAGQAQASDPIQGTGCTPTTWQKGGDFFFPQFGAAPCSLATTVGSSKAIPAVKSSADCCLACVAEAGCGAYNWCSNDDGCSVPGLVGGPDDSACFLYPATTAVDWHKHLAGSACAMDDWWTGMLSARANSSAESPPEAVWRVNAFMVTTSGLCSLATLGDFMGVAYEQPGPAACSAACASTAGCTAWNYCYEGSCVGQGGA